MKTQILYNNEKLSTHIGGLDELLFGGLHLQALANQMIEKPLSIVIRGEIGTSRALLAMQMLHGITKSLHSLRCHIQEDMIDSQKYIVLDEPIFYTENKSVENISDMLVDNVISKCIRQIIEANITERTDSEGRNRTWQGSQFCQTLFSVPESTTLPIELDKLDLYIAQGILVYNLRTNSLHVGLPSTSVSIFRSDNPLAIPRRHSCLNDFYSDRQHPVSQLAELASEFFPVSILSGETNRMEDLIGRCMRLQDEQRIPCLVLDKKFEPLDKTIARKVLVVIYVTDADEPLEQYNADLVIDMRSHIDPKTDYLCYQLSIVKSVLQDTAHGWHQYKKRDYGIEVYPSTHVILQRRRHMPKGLLRAPMGIMTETYQHYIDKQKDYCCIPALSQYINTYMASPGQCLENNLQDLYTHFSKTDNSGDILKDIFIKSDNEPRITAIIGPANSYKRYLTLGGTFSACCKNEHTLYILLDKDDNIILKKMICPATIFRDPQTILQGRCDSCLNCYKCIHFKEIRMGCISTDEFFYYLIQQLRMSNNGNNKGERIHRIVLDDLQKIEYCFPMIDHDSLFLPGLVSICKDYAVDLFVLCDKSSSKVDTLRANADNVICTERTPDYDLNIYVERYVGYSSPSHIWGCHVNNVKDLFCCDIRSDGYKGYRLNEKNIVEFPVYSMEKYWER